MTTSDLLADYLDWPGQRQVFMVERERVRVATGEVERETVYGVTSLPPERADAWRLLTLVREHWHIENRSHWVRDLELNAWRSA